ncbi:peptidoglycan DD-metalloendopeptidase family protein [Ferrovibrio sp.]|uniref:peptidoglycan DD-metalloendopeptidase family protein n=1 Tax=Ferrovibrio sp. TaxID=1917215 RepID=UPI003D0E1B8D
MAIGSKLKSLRCVVPARFMAPALVLLLAACGQQSPAPVTFNHRLGPAQEQQPSYASRRAAPAAPVAMAAADTGFGGDITVQRGDTLYGLARQHNIAARSLIDANGLQEPYHLQVGQQLRLPAGAASHDRVQVVQREAPAVVAAAPVQTQAAQTQATPRSSGGFALSPAPVAPALSGTGVMVEELPSPTAQAAPPARHVAAAAKPAPVVAAAPKPQAAEPVREEAVALAPVQIAAPAQAEPEPQPVAQAPAVQAPVPVAQAVAPAPVTAPVTAPAIPAAPVMVPTPVAAAVPPQTFPGAPSAKADDEPPPRAGRTFAWPVRGRILSTFGQKPDGMHNDGINIAARAGSGVISAENGVVVYAGSEVRGFGNLVLVRHADGWITAYAHLDRVLVQKGQKVTRGQAIATVGSSGGVDQPQLHFEIRRGTQAVDPAKFLTVAMLENRETAFG